MLARRHVWIALACASAAPGCYQSHALGDRCGDEICDEWDHCCVTCGEARCITLDLPCHGDEMCDGCWTSAECDLGSYCDRPSCDGYGACVPIPDCFDEPCRGVCGCDRNDYCNECHAARAGVGVSHEGSCDTPLCGGVVCPVDMICCPGCDGDGFCAGAFAPCPAVECPTETCSWSGECAPDEWCDFPPGVCGRGGTCRPRPRGCDDDCPGVCGCDGVIYCNDCNAAGAGVDVIGPAGACPERCGRGGRACTPGEFCDLGGACGALDGHFCRPRPGICEDIEDPVCGCDGVTYGNECEAHANGVTVASPGPCEG